MSLFLSALFSAPIGYPYYGVLTTSALLLLSQQREINAKKAAVMHASKYNLPFLIETMSYDRYELANSVKYKYTPIISKIEIVYVFLCFASCSLLYYIYAYLLNWAKINRVRLPKVIISWIYMHLQLHTKETPFRNECVAACIHYNKLFKTFDLKNMLQYVTMLQNDGTEISPKLGRRKRIFITFSLTEIFSFILSYFYVKYLILYAYGLFQGYMSYPLTIPEDVLPQLSQENITLMNEYINYSYNSFEIYYALLNLGYLIIKVILFYLTFFHEHIIFIYLALKVTYKNYKLTNANVDFILGTNMDSSIKYICLNIIYEKALQPDLKDQIIRKLIPFDFQ